MTVRQFIIVLLTLIALTPASAKGEEPFFLSGRVKDAVTKFDLVGADVITYDAKGNPVDTLKADKGIRYKRDEGSVGMSIFGIVVQRKDSILTFDVSYPGYTTQSVVYRLEKIGKREQQRNMPVVYLERAPHKLGEVTVTASKIKFYNKGDTIVYNADAFQLAEGSMLDALIAQLPGVQLEEGGQIKVNGEYVESLLLNGKQFLDGNNQLMLENIGAYTVKNVEVYEGQTKMEKWMNRPDDPTAPKHLTMDVKLKKEYNMGWIINAQGGIGTDDRYSGRLFASWFSPTTKLTLIANANNLNDNRKPGKSDTWRPEMMPSGTRRNTMAALNYNYESLDESKDFHGYIEMDDSRQNNRSTTARTNFLNSGNTYDNIFSRNKDRKLKLETRNYINIYKERYGMWTMLLGRYIKRDNYNNQISATFNKEQSDITAKALEALYSDGSPERLDAVINRSITRSDGSSREYEVQAYPTFTYKVPRTNDQIRVQVGARYKDNKEERWRDYNINYGADPMPAVVRRQYFDNSPNRTLTLDGTISYDTQIGAVSAELEYSYRFMDRDKDSYMYALDQLADMGVYGTLPAGYLDSFDPNNSYTSRQMDNVHTICPRIRWGSLSEKNYLMILLYPEFSLMHQHLDYWRANRSYLVKSTSFLTESSGVGLDVRYSFNKKESSRRSLQFVNDLEFSLKLSTKVPDPLHRVDIENDADPLNISLGNPDLKVARVFNPTIEWTFNPKNKTLNNTLRLNCEWTTNALVRGYTYDTKTGVRRNRTYNVDGNNSASASNYFDLQFGSKQQFTLSSVTNGNIINSSDMIGTDMQEPEKSQVRSNMLSQKLGIGWQIGKQSLKLTGEVNTRHTTSSREDFKTINANHYSYGFIGTFALPGGFGISTDFMLYSRRGYGMKELDTTDAIWNMRLTYTPKGGRWVFMADGFDMLHQLSNVNYAVNASGRTVTYSNALPRYMMFSVQYRMNIQPKKKRYQQAKW